MTRLIYMAHPVSGDAYDSFHSNTARAITWFSFLRSLSPVGCNRLLMTKPDKVTKIHRKAVNAQTFETSYRLVNPFTDGCTFIAPWLAVQVHDSRYPGGRIKALNDCRRVVEVCDEMWMVGSRVSRGMDFEAEGAKLLRDLTFWGRLPPEWSDPELFIAKG